MSSGVTFAVTGGDGRPYDMPAETALAGAIPAVTFAQTGETQAKTLPDHLADKANLDLGLIPADIFAPFVSLDTVSGVSLQALTDVIASLSLAPPATPGTIWRNQSFVAISTNADGTPYTAPYGSGLSGSVDPVTALLAIVVPRILRGLPTDPPSGSGMLWLNSGKLALSPNIDGTPYPVIPLPSSGSAILQAVRAALGPWLASTMPALPSLLPLSSGALWRAPNILALS